MTDKMCVVSKGHFWAKFEERHEDSIETTRNTNEREGLGEELIP